MRERERERERVTSSIDPPESLVVVAVVGAEMSLNGTCQKQLTVMRDPASKLSPQRVGGKD